MSSKAACFIAAICLCAAAFGVYGPLVSPHPYSYDEADYMWAGEQGFVANYTDQHGLSLVEFIRKGLELSRDSGKRQSFSEYIRSTGDIGSYRHYHGPMYAYWLAAMQHAGLVKENMFRGSSLLIHFASAMLILFGMWTVFPSLPPIAGLVACALFIFNRTGLTAATIITQHVVFTFFSIAFLFALSLFMRTFDKRYFYASAAILGAAFCTLETSFLLVAALAVAMLLEHKRIREEWPSLKSFAGLLGKGAAIFLAAVLVCWPKGLLELGIAKGFLTLAYISIYRKTFSPFGTLDLWSAKFNASPWEFSLLIVGAVAAFALWRRFKNKRELTPWLVFIAIFFAITLKITVTYTYYYAPLAAALTVATGAAFGILWERWAVAGRAGLVLLVMVSIAGTTVQFRGVVRESHEERPYPVAVLHLLREHPPAAGLQFYLPYQLVPMLHFYHPEISTVGYDFDFPIGRLLDGIESPAAAGTMLCEEEFCAALDRQLPGFSAGKTLIDPAGPSGQPLYLVQVRKSRSL